MLDFIGNSFLWILALYGLFEIIKTIVNLYTYTKFKSNGIYMIIATKNQDKNIEMFLRALIFKIVYGKEDLIKNIIVTDLDSTDDTKKILLNFEKDFEFIKFCSWKDCQELMNNIKSN